MNVQVTEYYVTGCAECMAIVENITRSFIRDATGSKLVLLGTAKQHCHEVQPKKQIAEAAAASAALEPNATAPPDLSPPLFCAAELAAMGELGTTEALNGFDYSDRAAS